MIKANFIEVSDNQDMQFSYMMVTIQKGKKNIEDPDMNQLEYTGELNEED